MANSTKTRKDDTVPAYSFEVRGRYFSRTPRGKELKFYPKQTFILPQVVEYVAGREKVEKKLPNGKTLKTTKPKIVKENTLRCAKHLLLRYHLPARLREELEDFSGVHTIEILKKERVRVDPNEIKGVRDKDVSAMSESELLQFVALQDLLVNLSSFSDLADKRMAVEDAFRTRRKVVRADGRQIDEALKEPQGVFVSSGAVSSEDGVAIDDEDPATELL